MEIFNLVAKLTLDKNEYERSLQEAESDAHGVEDIEANLSLDDNDFVGKVDDANEAEVDDIDSKLTLNEKEFSEGVQQAEADGKSLEGTLGDIFTNIKGLLVTAGIATAIGGIVSSLTEAVNLASSLGDDVDKGSRRLNISAEAYQEWSHALSQSGATINDFNRGILSMNKYMSGADVTEDVSNAFNTLGMSAKIANGEITNTESLLTETVKALADFSGTKEERGALATAIFGRGGSTLNALFDSGSEGIQQLIDEAHELGLVMTDEEVANSVAYGDAVANMNQSITAFKTAIVQDIIPGLTDAANLVAKIVAFFNPRNKQQSLSDMYAGAEDEFADQLVEIEATGNAAETLVDKLMSMGETSKMTAEQYEVWKGTAQELIKLVPSLGEQIDIETGKIEGNSESLKANIQEWENLARQKALQSLKEAKLQAIWKKDEELIDKSVEANRKAADAEGKRAAALDALNSVLTAHGLEALDGNATFEDALKAQTDAILGFTGSEDELASFSTEMSGAISAWTSAIAEANEAQKNADALTEEIEKGKQEYEEWVATANELYGITDEQAKDATSDVGGLNTSLSKLPKRKQIYIDLLVSEQAGLDLPLRAKGDWDVPYDMPVMVHRDETILTASQARQYREGKAGSNVDLSGLKEEIVGAIREGMQDITVSSYLNGKDITDDVSRNAGNRLKARRFRG